jgi:uncharacterized membrane protein
VSRDHPSDLDLARVETIEKIGEAIALAAGEVLADHGNNDPVADGLVAAGIVYSLQMLSRGGRPRIETLVKDMLASGFRFP